MKSEAVGASSEASTAEGTVRSTLLEIKRLEAAHADEVALRETQAMAASGSTSELVAQLESLRAERAEAVRHGEAMEVAQANHVVEKENIREEVAKASKHEASLMEKLEYEQRQCEDEARSYKEESTKTATYVTRLTEEVAEERTRGSTAATRVDQELKCLRDELNGAEQQELEVVRAEMQASHQTREQNEEHLQRARTECLQEGAAAKEASDRATASEQQREEFAERAYRAERAVTDAIAETADLKAELAKLRAQLAAAAVQTAPTGTAASGTPVAGADDTSSATLQTQMTQADTETGKVLGLSNALGDVGLAQYAVAANAWCKENGAELLEEVVEFFDDFVSALDLPAADREKLLCRLDPEVIECRRLVDETDAELQRLNAQAKAAPKKQKGGILDKIKELETTPDYVAAKRFLEDPGAERERKRFERCQAAETKVREAIGRRDLSAATVALAEYRSAGGVSGSEPGSLAGDVVALRAELNADTPEDRNKRMDLRRSRSKQSFAFDPPKGAELEAKRTLLLRVDAALNPGLDAYASWYGMVVAEIDPDPGQPELRIGDCIMSISGTSLREMDDCEQAFVDGLADGVEIVVEPQCTVTGAVPPGVEVDWETLEIDMANFAQDYQVDLSVTADHRELRLSGPQSAVTAARLDALNFLGTYFALDA